MNKLRQLLMTASGCLICIHSAFGAATAPANAVNRLQAGQGVDLIVEYESAAVEQEAAKRRQLTQRHLDDAGILDYKATQYKILKQQVDGTFSSQEITHLKDYSHLPMSFKHVQTLAALNALIAHPGIKAIFENGQLHHVLTKSLPMVNQPQVAAVGETGGGTTVAVIDDGIDYTNAAFGSCTAPGIPAACHVIASVLFGTGTTDTSHGTNVSAIVLGMAPTTRIAMLNAFSGTTAYFSDVISAINWTIANQSAYNIAAINMSLGDGSKNTAPCSNARTNPFVTPVNSAMSAGITVVASSGNDAYTNAIGSPACTPGIISVGAVYDANYGGLTWGANLCTDLSTAADLVTCFSDSASFLTMLAPGAIITAAGITMAGTSQASPHVAGAVAVLRSAFPAETLSQTQARLINGGVQVTDPRNGLVKPRLNLLESARPADDMFANRFLLSGGSGSTSGTSLLATKEARERNHAGNSGGASVWWKWIAPSSGQVSLNTHGSGFDTLLAVYTGASVSALTPIAANDNDGTAGGTSGLLFEAIAGQEYEIAVDGFNGAAGSVVLNWSLNTTATAAMSVNITGPTNASSGNAIPYTVTVTNAGPQTATNVVVTITLPAGANFVSGPAGCSANISTITCMPGNIANGANISLLIQIMLSNGVAMESISANVSSDLPNPAPAGSTTNIQVAVSGNNDNDVPALPWWGQLILATILGGIAITTRKRT